MVGGYRGLSLNRVSSVGASYASVSRYCSYSICGGVYRQVRRSKGTSRVFLHVYGGLVHVFGPLHLVLFFVRYASGSYSYRVFPHYGGCLVGVYLRFLVRQRHRGRGSGRGG